MTALKDRSWGSGPGNKLFALPSNIELADPELRAQLSDCEKAPYRREGSNVFMGLTSRMFYISVRSRSKMSGWWILAGTCATLEGNRDASSILPVLA
jgi:hypothetical protein